MLEYPSFENIIPLRMVPSFGLQIPPGETVNSLQTFAYVLDCISFLFRRHIPEVGIKGLVVENLHHPSTPICQRNECRIYLNTEPHLWAQIAYQFSHELCHYAIPSEVPSNLRWLEESICETASFYFLRQIAYLWMERGLPLKTSDGAPYAPSFISYADQTALRATPFDIHDPSEIAYLEGECYDRNRNSHVANLLLPIFVALPDTWKAIPYLCRISQPTLTQALDAWIAESPPSARAGLLRIRSLFEGEHHDPAHPELLLAL